ncbi:MAG: DUF2218 domain-containing protein [Venatoribacter sp.]
MNQPSLQAQANISTDNPQRIMNRLSRHWAHKLEVKLEENNSLIKLPMGGCELLCTDQNLLVKLTANTAEEMATVQKVVADHLVRMAVPEELVISWQ